MTDPSPFAIRDVCVHCGSRPLRDHEGRIAGWSRLMGEGVEDHDHETLTGR
jgi:hypothetical protein